MKYLKNTLPILIISTMIIGLGYRKYLWCKVLLPASGEPYGLGDIVGIIPLILLGVWASIGVLTAFFLFMKSELREQKLVLLILTLSVVSIPIYLVLHSVVRPICNGG